MTTDPHIYQGEFCDLHIRPSDAPESVEVEVFSQKRKNGLWVEVPVAKVRSMLAASVPPGSYTRTDEARPLTPADITLHSANSASWVRVRVEHPALGVIEEGIPLPAASVPNVVTDEMVERAAKSRPGPNEWSHDIMRRVLIAALTEPPARPEGAEELARLIAEADVGEWDCGDLADYLLSTGRVRVTGTES